MTETTVAPRTNLTRATAGMSAVTLVSRLTGFVRVWVVLNVLGSTLLNDVYQSANYVPNILYELLAAGALQAVLVPQIVAELKHDDRRKADQLASSVLVHGSVILGVVAAIGIVLAPQIMAVSLGGISEPIARQRAITLGSQFLWLFLPQVVLYLINAVATALLNARDRFLLPAAAPLLNNIVVIATYLVFAAMRGDQEPNLLLTGPEKWVLAGGTTLGVVVFCVAVGAGAWADGFRPRRPLSPRDPALVHFGRQSTWAIAYLALQPLLVLVVIRLSSAEAGNFIIWQTAWQVFLLPHTVLAVPILTTRFPTMSRQVQAGDRRGFSGSVGAGVRAIATVSLVSGAFLVAAAPLVARVIAISDRAGDPDVLAGGLIGFAPGLIGFGIFLLLTRAFYALDDTRTPALVNVVATSLAALAMIVGIQLVSDELRVGAMSLGFSLGQTFGAAVLAVLLYRRGVARDSPLARLGAEFGRRLAAAAGATALGWMVAHEFVGAGWSVAALGSGVTGGVVVATFLVLWWGIGGPTPGRAVKTMGATERGWS